MLKIFLIEDEIIVREGIRKKINWEEEGFIFVGEASDGEMALPMIREYKPDVIITDIKMPFMDGLELSRLVKSELPWVKIIILSGFDDFDYAKVAIEIGITEYLLKPISKDKILETIRRVKNIIEKEKYQKKLMDRFEESKKDMVNADQLKLLEKLVTPGSTVLDLIETAKQNNIDIISKNYTLILFRYTYRKKDNGLRIKIQQIKEQIVTIYKNNNRVILFDRGMEGFVLILKSNDDEGLKNVSEISENLGDLVFDLVNINCYISVSKSTTRLLELPELYRDAANRLSYQYLVDEEGALFTYSDDSLEQVFLTADRLNIDAINRKIVEDFLKTGAIEEMQSFVDSYFQNIGEENLQSLIFRQYVVMDIQITAFGFLKEIDEEYSSDNIKYSSKELIDVFSTFESTRNYLIDFLKEILRIRGEKMQKVHSGWICEAREYIDINFSDKELSLKNIAAMVSVTPSHFSSVFSQEVGSTFIEYLTSARVNKAKALLRFTDKKSSAIADEVGYNDPHYFSQLFKKTAGISPKAYRTNR